MRMRGHFIPAHSCLNISIHQLNPLDIREGGVVLFLLAGPSKTSVNQVQLSTETHKVIQVPYLAKWMRKWPIEEGNKMIKTPL